MFTCEQLNRKFVDFDHQTTVKKSLLREMNYKQNNKEFYYIHQNKRSICNFRVSNINMRNVGLKICVLIYQLKIVYNDLKDLKVNFSAL